MKLSTWRPGLMSFFAGQFQIDSYELREPVTVGETCFFAPPLRNIHHFQADGTNRATAIQDVFISTRYARSLKYSQLPIATVEGIYSTVSQKILRVAEDIAAIINLDLTTPDYPIQVSETGDGLNKLGDWLITQHYSIKIFWQPEPEAADPDRFIHHINLGIYRAYQDNFDDKTKDFQASIP
jgi:hypothetical protein